MHLQAVVLSLLEALVRHTETVIANAEVILDVLMPALVAAVSADVGGDMRFGCLKVLGDVIATLLSASRPGELPFSILAQSLIFQIVSVKCCCSLWKNTPSPCRHTTICVCCTHWIADDHSSMKYCALQITLTPLLINLVKIFFWGHLSCSSNPKLNLQCP